MKIGQLLTSLSWRGGGVSELARGLSLALSRRGVAVEVFGVQDAATNDALETWHPLQPRLARRVGPVPLAWAPGQLRALLDARLDALHVHGLWTSQSWRALRWARESARPYVVSPHGMLDAWALRRSGAAKRLACWLFETRHLKRAACLHSLCAAESAAIRAYGYRGAICEIPPAVEPASDGSAPATAPWRPVEAGRSVLLYLGRLHPKKGLPALVAGWAEARRQSRPLTEAWHLVLAGWDEGGHAAELASLARASGVADSMSLVGPVLGADRSASYRAARAFVLPSLSEGLPLVVLEAWAHGLPVLMTEACHLPEGFDARAALRFPPEPGGIARGLLGLLALSDGERAAMGEHGRKLVERRFSWSAVAPRFVAVYAWLAGAAPRPDWVQGAA